MKRIQICSNEGPRFFPRGDNYKIVKINWWNLKIFFSRTAKPIWTKLSTTHPWVKGIQICSNEGPRFFLRGDNYVKAKIHWRNFKIYYSWTARPITTKLGTRHPWVKWIQFCSNEGFHPFPRGDNYEKAKIHSQNLKLFFSRTTEPVSTKLGTKQMGFNFVQRRTI